MNDKFLIYGVFNITASLLQVKKFQQQRAPLNEGLLDTIGYRRGAFEILSIFGLNASKNNFASGIRR